MPVRTMEARIVPTLDFCHLSRFPLPVLSPFIPSTKPKTPSRKAHITPVKKQANAALDEALKSIVPFAITDPMATIENIESVVELSTEGLSLW